MKIAVIGANGKSGRLIVKEAIEKGLDVTAIVRNSNKTIAEKFLVKDIFDLTKSDLKDFDVVVSAFGIWDENKLDMHSKVIEHLSNLLANSETKLIVVGGAGSLYMDKAHTIRLIDTPEFPDEYKPVAEAMGNALNILRSKKDVIWLYISPAAFFNHDGIRSGKYIVGGEEFIVDKNGHSEISYADYALALVDQILNPQYLNQRISVIAEY